MEPIRKLALMGAGMRAASMSSCPVDAQAIAQANGIRVLFVDFKPEYSPKVGSFLDPEEQAIYVNKAMPGDRINYAIAYELGLALARKEAGLGKPACVSPLSLHIANPSEPHWAEADAFARGLLISNEHLSKYREHVSSPQLAKIFAIPGCVLLRHQMSTVRPSPDVRASPEFS